MKVLELIAAIITELKTITAFGNNVFGIASRIAIPFDPIPTPMAGVVYRGSDVSYQKGLAKNRYVHHFTIYIVQKIWGMESAVTDSTEGVLVLLKLAADELKDQKFLAVDLGIIPEIKNYLGTEDYLDYGYNGASIGFEIDYLEVET